MIMLGPILLLHGGCTTQTLDQFEVCELEVVLTPEAGAPGDRIIARGGPYTEVRDTRVRVGGSSAEVLSVSFERPAATGDTGVVDLTVACAECEACRAEAGCGPCGSCSGAELGPARREVCFGVPGEAAIGICDLCQQQLTFEVPPLSPGPASVWIINRNGTSPAVPFTVLGASPTGSTADTGATLPFPTGGTADTGTTPTTPLTGTTGVGTGDTGVAGTSTGDTAIGGSGALSPTGGTGGS